MNKYLSLFLVLIVLSGCVSAQIKPPLDSINRIRKIKVVPMEAQPLEMLFLTDASLFTSNVFWVNAPVGSIQTGGRVLVMISGIFVLMELPEAAKQSAKVAESFESMLGSREAWIPTMILAQEAAKQITSKGKYDVTVMQTFHKFPGLINRERTFSGENWQAPIRSWYNNNTSPFDYKSLKNQGIDAVLEVGMLNYSLYNDTIIVQVSLKLVDPSTGQVLGRARAYDHQKIETSGLFENNGRNFKDLFASIGRKLLTDDLKSIGLLPE